MILKPKVSVLMPVYNGDKFLRHAIESVLTQTFSDFELIIIDDASSDNSAAIIKSYSDSRIKYFRNEVNSGIVKTLNRGLQLAEGVYIARMDADDICMADRLSKQVALLDEHSDIGICGADCQLINDKGAVIGKNICPTDPEEWRIELMFRTPVAHPLVMIRRSVLIECGGYREGMEPAEDYDLWIRVSKLCKGANIPEYLLKYRMHDANYSSKKRDMYSALLCKILEDNAAYLGLDVKYVRHHINFIIGDWDVPVTAHDVKTLKSWKNGLIARNKVCGKYATGVFREIINKYYTKCLVKYSEKQQEWHKC